MNARTHTQAETASTQQMHTFAEIVCFISSMRAVLPETNANHNGMCPPFHKSLIRLLRVGEVQRIELANPLLHRSGQEYDFFVLADQAGIRRASAH